MLAVPGQNNDATVGLPAVYRHDSPGAELHGPVGRWFEGDQESESDEGALGESDRAPATEPQTEARPDMLRVLLNLAPRIGRMQAIADPPVRAHAVALRDQLSDFVRDNTREPSRFGFGASSNRGVSVEALKTFLFQKSKELDLLTREDQDRTPFGVSLRAFAGKLHDLTDRLRVHLVRGPFAGAVSEDHQHGLLESLIEHRDEVRMLIHSIDVYFFQLQSAAEAVGNEM